MAQKIVIDPVTRIEGHAKITIQLNDAGEVEDAHFHVTQLRGFEKFCEGRPFHEMPSLMARICGICPVSHHLAAAKARNEQWNLGLVWEPDTHWRVVAEYSLHDRLNFSQLGVTGTNPRAPQEEIYGQMLRFQVQWFYN